MTKKGLAESKGAFLFDADCVSCCRYMSVVNHFTGTHTPDVQVVQVALMVGCHDPFIAGCTCGFAKILAPIYPVAMHPMALMCWLGFARGLAPWRWWFGHSADNDLGTPVPQMRDCGCCHGRKAACPLTSGATNRWNPASQAAQASIDG